MDVDAAIEKVVETIRDEYEPEKIILFGSRVWGKPDDESDLDVLVIKRSRKPEIERMQDVSRLLQPRPLPVDILVKTPDEIHYRLAIGDYFMREIMERGKVAYERSAV